MCINTQQQSKCEIPWVCHSFNHSHLLRSSLWHTIEAFCYCSDSSGRYFTICTIVHNNHYDSTVYYAEWTVSQTVGNSEFGESSSVGSAHIFIFLPNFRHMTHSHQSHSWTVIHPKRFRHSFRPHWTVWEILS